VIVVLDSNIWVSALHFGGLSRYALKVAFLSDSIAVCDEIEAEVRRILTEKFGWTSTRLVTDFDRLIFNSQMVPVTGAIQGVCRDPKDDMVLECAVNARAEAIVTGDRDLLVLESYRSIRILTGRQYLNEYLTGREG
jgi:putative PIN family toxin of toxin-antitoxin system